MAQKLSYMPCSFFLKRLIWNSKHNYSEQNLNILAVLSPPGLSQKSLKIANVGLRCLCRSSVAPFPVKWVYIFIIFAEGIHCRLILFRQSTAHLGLLGFQFLISSEWRGGADHCTPKGSIPNHVCHSEQEWTLNLLFLPILCKQTAALYPVEIIFSCWYCKVTWHA